MQLMTPEEFKNVRETLGLTPVELAEQLGVNRTTVQRYERGLSPIPRATELALSALIGARGGAHSLAPQAAE